MRIRLSWDEGVKKCNRMDEAKKSQECGFGGETLAERLTPSTTKVSALVGKDPAGGGWVYSC